MKITKNVRKCAAEQGIDEEEALKRGMEEKSKEFVEKGAEVYAKAEFLHHSEQPRQRSMR
jgi:phosphomethylpyrimidine synthase